MSDEQVEAIAMPVEHTAEPAIVPQKLPTKLEEVDRLAIENIFLKMQVAQGQVEKCDQTKAQVVATMQQLQAEMQTKKTELAAKYGVDIGRTNILADGTIVRPTPGQP